MNRVGHEERSAGVRPGVPERPDSLRERPRDEHEVGVIRDTDIPKVESPAREERPAEEPGDRGHRERARDEAAVGHGRGAC